MTSAQGLACRIERGAGRRALRPAQVAASAGPCSAAAAIVTTAIAPSSTKATARADHVVKGIGGIDRREGGRRARGGEHAGDMGGRDRGEGRRDLAAAHPLAGRDQREREEGAGGNARAGSEEPLLDRVADEKHAAEGKGDAADPDRPSRAERLLQAPARRRDGTLASGGVGSIGGMRGVGANGSSRGSRSGVISGSGSAADSAIGCTVSGGTARAAKGRPCRSSASTTASRRSNSAVRSRSVQARPKPQIAQTGTANASRTRRPISTRSLDVVYPMLSPNGRRFTKPCAWPGARAC